MRIVIIGVICEECMYLDELRVKGFRCFDEEFKIPFSPGLNVIVGENGAGKTAIISAIRQLFQDSESGRYSISQDDFYSAFTQGSPIAPSFSIKAHFKGLDSDEKVALLPWSGGTDTAVLNLQAENREVRGRYKKLVWGGSSRSTQFDPELLDLIQCIYLPPLRDAESKLTNGRQSRLSKLLKAINRKELKECKKNNTPHPLEEQFKNFNDTLVTDESLSIKGANELITEHLVNAIGHHFGQKTRIQFAESDFTKIAESLTLLFFPDMSADDQDLFRSLNQNSLGYNNLLYIASILAELTLNDDDGEDEQPLFKLLLIEEPEAHLHPQLQIRLLNYLKSVADKNNNVQVIVTSHSTVLASSVEIDSIIHLSKSSSPTATPLRSCGLPDGSIQFINRWLDVTKSNLLFASGLILVEGIAEQMLFPILAKEVLKEQSDGKKNLEDLGVSTINLNGIYFKHFIRLYCNLTDLEDEEDQEGLNIPVRCAGVTDLDPPKKQTIQVASEENEDETIDKEVDFIPHDSHLLEGMNHAIKLVDSINSSENARLFVSKYKTLEYDLAMEGNNVALMAEVVASLWPKPKTGNSTVIDTLNQIAGQEWTTKTSEEKSVSAHEILKRIDDDKVGKGIFAQVFTDKIEKEKLNISVPKYIEDAILWSCSLEKTEEQE
ncbi:MULTISPECIES: ATP-dependent nuclease [Vibrio harveyi group]|nr:MULTISPECIES: AAA family ATPase [Vibrio harveyi group]ANZ12646.1 RecF/RecN/SMC N domain protein [Vibrio parahaemolyticus]MCR9721233.1 AAA family ATPase [Vibrio parahaemolyticus]MCR9947755.1 AAA family ATPase [Vibrio parahaemolyticus]MCR9991603.1 AAA family ATPase [Vibrio parahaemolyticus]MCR9998014.1 AAA family ATPase [Vibrio parahaemolyticus]